MLEDYRGIVKSKGEGRIVTGISREEHGQVWSNFKIRGAKEVFNSCWHPEMGFKTVGEVCDPKPIN